jgi:hypothetical protein
MTSSISTHSPDTATLALAIVDTVREPLLVLDKDLRVVAASRSFYLTFKVESTNTVGRLLYALGDGQWDIPRLRLLLENIVPEHGVMDDFEVEHQFPGVGRRTMLLPARYSMKEIRTRPFCWALKMSPHGVPWSATGNS